MEYAEYTSPQTDNGITNSVKEVKFLLNIFLNLVFGILLS